MPNCSICKQAICCCVPISAPRPQLWVSAGPLSPTQPRAKRMRMDFIQEAKSFSEWRQSALSYINGIIQQTRTKLAYTEEDKTFKHYLHRFNTALNRCSSYADVQIILETYKKVFPSIVAKLRLAVEQQSLVQDDIKAIEMSIKSDYIVFDEIVCISDVEEAKSLVTGLQRLCESLHISIRLLKSSIEDHIWIRDKYIAFRNTENLSGGFIMWERNVDDEDQKKYRMLASEREYSFSSAAKVSSLTWLESHYRLVECPLHKVLDSDQELVMGPLCIQGGNLVVAERASDLSKVVMIGENSIMQHIHAIEPHRDFSAFYDLEMEVPAVHKGSDMAYLHRRRQLKNKLFKNFGLKETDTVMFLPDADFHLDCFLFTPCPGVVFLNDMRLMQDEVFKHEIEQHFSKKHAQAFQLFIENDCKKIVSILDMVAFKLERKGLKVLRAPLSLPNYKYSIAGQKVIISECFNLANGLSLKSGGQYHYAVAKSYFPRLEQFLKTLLHQENVVLHLLGDERENSCLLEAHGSLRCITNVFTPDCLE